MRSKINFVNSILNRRSQGYRIAAKRFAEAKLVVAERDLTVALHLTDVVNSSVLQGPQLFGERPVAKLIATSQHRHPQGFMRQQVIVAVAPLIKTNLHAAKVAIGPLGQHFHFQTPMKTFVFTLSLRMIRSTVVDANTQSLEPNRQRRVLMRKVITPGRPVVHQHALRQTITTKSGGQLLLHGLSLLIAASLQAQRITSQRRLSLPFQAPFDLARTPAILVANRQHLLLYCRFGPTRRMLGSPRSISQPCGSGLLVSLQPFVSSLSTNPKPLTQLAEFASRLICQKQKLLSQAHGRTLLPRHVSLLKRFSCHCRLCYPCPRTSVTYVSGPYTQREGAGRGSELLPPL